MSNRFIGWTRGFLLLSLVSVGLTGRVPTAIAQPPSAATPLAQAAPEAPTQAPPTAITETSLLSRAQTALREERYLEAEQHWRELVRQWPDSAEMSYGLGSVLHRQFKIEEAAQAYVTAAVLNPNHREAHINLSLARIQLGQGEEALAPLEHVLSLPDRPSKPASIHAMAYYNRAVVLGRQGKLEESRRAVDAALAIAPNFREAQELIDLIR